MNGVLPNEFNRQVGKTKFLGDMLGTVEIVGDIVSPVIDLEEIDAYKKSPTFPEFHDFV